MARFHSEPYGSLRSKLLNALKAFCGQEHIVVVSRPLCINGRWTIIQGDRFRFSVREFSSESEAWFGFRSVASATALGTGIVQIKVVVLSEEQARLVKERSTYQEILEFLDRNSSH